MRCPAGQQRGEEGENHLPLSWAANKPGVLQLPSRDGAEEPLLQVARLIRFDALAGHDEQRLLRIQEVRAAVPGFIEVDRPHSSYDALGPVEHGVVECRLLLAAGVVGLGGDELDEVLQPRPRSLDEDEVVVGNPPGGEDSPGRGVEYDDGGDGLVLGEGKIGPASGQGATSPDRLRAPLLVDRVPHVPCIDPGRLGSRARRVRKPSRAQATSTSPARRVDGACTG